MITNGYYEIQKRMRPEGGELTNDNPMKKIRILAVNQPCTPPSALSILAPKSHNKGKSPTQTMPAGPAGSEKEIVDAIEGTRPMILNATAKICTVEYARRNSCL